MFATEVSANLLLSDAATCVDYDDESVCIIVKESIESTEA